MPDTATNWSEANIPATAPSGPPSRPDTQLATSPPETLLGTLFDATLGRYQRRLFTRPQQFGPVPVWHAPQDLMVPVQGHGQSPPTEGPRMPPIIWPGPSSGPNPALDTPRQPVPLPTHRTMLERGARVIIWKEMPLLKHYEIVESWRTWITYNSAGQDQAFNTLAAAETHMESMCTFSRFVADRTNHRDFFALIKEDGYWANSRETFEEAERSKRWTENSRTVYVSQLAKMWENGEVY